MEIIVQKNGAEAERTMQDLLGSCAGNPLTAALCGCIFEPYAIEQLERGGNFTCRQLVHGKKKHKPGDTTVDIPPSHKIVVDRITEGQIHNQLYVPITKNFTAIDAWIPGIGAFQMTVGKNHGIKISSKQELAKLGKIQTFYWLLPPLYYKTFTKKTPQEIDQYALLIPYSE